MIRISKPVLVALFFVFISAKINAQQDSTQAPPPPRLAKDKIPFKDRIFFGGNFGLQFGDQTYIELSPTIGYKVTEKFHAGVGIKYIYYKFKYYYSPTQISTSSSNIYGGSIFGRYYVTENFFLHSEVEILNLDVWDDFAYKFERKNIISPFVGGGYLQRLGDTSGLFILVLFNLNDTKQSPYGQNPIIRIGFNVGI